MELQKGSKALVVGLGKSGIAAVRFLHRQGLRVAVSDSRPVHDLPEQDLRLLRELDVELEAGGHTDKFIEPGILVVPSPGVGLDSPLLQSAARKKCVIAGELALAAGRIKPPVIAVTGTNGKTTVTSLIGHLLRAAGREVFVGGNIGTPVLEYVLNPGPVDTVVLELSSFQLETSGAFRPNIALLLNLSPDHLDRHGDMAAYAAAKQRIFANQLAGGVAIVGGDDQLIDKKTISTAGTVLDFGHAPEHDAIIEGDEIVLSFTARGERFQESYNLRGTRLDSRSNRLNAAAAVLTARVSGCAPDKIQQGLVSYQPPEHRMHMVAEFGGARWIDDSKATNIGAVIAALAACGGPVTLIAGGRNKGSDFSMLREPVSRRVKHLLLIGEASRAMAGELGDLVETEQCRDMHEAVSKAAAATRPGDTVLLAPGCASFDMFSGYAERGRVFQEAVLAVATKYKNNNEETNQPTCQPLNQYASL